MGSVRLEGRVALIIGALNRVGQVITERYLAEGATVVAADYDKQALSDYRDRLVQPDTVPSERVSALVLDAGNIAQTRADVAEVVQRLGRVDVLVNSLVAGEEKLQLREIDPAHLQGQGVVALQGQLGTIWATICAVAPAMQRGSSILSISACAPSADASDVLHRVSSAALQSFSLGLAEELGPRGIRVNMVSLDTTGNTVDDGSRATEQAFSDLSEAVNTAVFLGSTESVGLNGQILNMASAKDALSANRTTFVSRPGLRTVDATGQVVLVCVGDQVEDTLALTGVLRSCGAEVVLGFRSRSAISYVEQVLQDSRRLQGPSYTPPPLVYFNPLESETTAAVLASVQEEFGAVDAVIVLPATGVEQQSGSLVDVSDEYLTQFLQQEVNGAVVIASQLTRFWDGNTLARQPRVIFMTNGDDGQGNVYANIARASVEELVQALRLEGATESAQAESSEASVLVWANQIIRYVNKEDENLEFACAWAAKLLSSNRQIDELSLYLPEHIIRTTGARRPSFGWAESLFGQHLGKVAVITGGSAGIGGEVGRLLALSGASLLLAARGAGQLEQLRERILRELREVGYSNVDARVQILPGIDVANEDELKRLVEHTLDVFGRVDYLINNAGISGVEEMVIDMPLDGWNRTLQANLISNFSLIRKLAPLMKAQGSGYVLNVSSYFGGEKYVAVPYPNRSDYAVSKAGQRAMVEAFARFLGPEIQINALAPGPVDGDRLRGSAERPGLFMRRARLIMENKRLNEVHAAVIESHRATGQSILELIKVLLSTGVEALSQSDTLPDPLRRLAGNIWEKNDPQGSSRSHLLNAGIAEKFVHRLELGGHLDQEDAAVLLADVPEPPQPFFARTQIEREARKVRDGIIGMLYLQRMPTEFDVAMATVYYLADVNVSGETFHPSGGLKFERTVTEGELFGKAGQHRLERLRGMTVYLIGEHLSKHLLALARVYLEEYDVGRVVLLTATENTARTLLGELPEHRDSGRLCAIATNGDVVQGINEARATYGDPGPVVCTPFHPLPTLSLVGGSDGDWTGVLDEQDFADLLEHNITHHFRATQKISLIDGAQIVLVTPETSARSTAEEFALANFVKTTLHAFTATAGVESERTVHRVPVNQVDLTRRARTEEPRNEAEEQEELRRFVDAVLLTSAPLPEIEDSRYRGRIYRGNAITV